MIRSRVSVVLLSGIFLLHLLVGGGGAAMGVGMEMEAMDHGQMMRQGMEMANASGGAGGQMDAPADEEPCSEPSPCPMPGMPGGCPVSAPCPAPASIPARQVSFALAQADASRPAAVELRAPHTRLSPPDSPPPRA